MFEKGEEKKEKKKKIEFRSDLNPDPLGCSLAALPLYHSTMTSVIP